MRTIETLKNRCKINPVPFNKTVVFMDVLFPHNKIKKKLIYFDKVEPQGVGVYNE